MRIWAKFNLNSHEILNFFDILRSFFVISREFLHFSLRNVLFKNLSFKIFK